MSRKSNRPQLPPREELEAHLSPGEVLPALDIAAPVPSVEPEDVEEIDPEESGELYVIQARQIDRFTIRRTRVLLQPCVCDECGLDLLDRNRQFFGAQARWDSLSPEAQQHLRNGVAEHKRRVHGPAHKPVVARDQLPTEWLGE